MENVGHIKVTHRSNSKLIFGTIFIKVKLFGTCGHYFINIIFFKSLNKIFIILDLAIASRSNEFDVDILDMIDVRGDLEVQFPAKMIKKNLPPTTSYPNSSVELSSPKGLKFRVEGTLSQASSQVFNEISRIFTEKSQEDPFQSVKIFIFKPKHLIKSGKFIEQSLTRDRSGEVWIYEMPDVVLNLHDKIEYWIYAEKSNLGYITQHILSVQGKLKKNLFS